MISLILLSIINVVLATSIDETGSYTVNFPTFGGDDDNDLPVTLNLGQAVTNVKLERNVLVYEQNGKYVLDGMIYFSSFKVACVDDEASMTVFSSDDIEVVEPGASIEPATDGEQLSTKFLCPAGYTLIIAQHIRGDEANQTVTLNGVQSQTTHTVTRDITLSTSQTDFVTVTDTPTTTTAALSTTAIVSSSADSQSTTSNTLISTSTSTADKQTTASTSNTVISTPTLTSTEQTTASTSNTVISTPTLSTTNKTSWGTTNKHRTTTCSLLTTSTKDCFSKTSTSTQDCVSTTSTAEDCVSTTSRRKTCTSKSKCVVTKTANKPIDKPKEPGENIGGIDDSWLTEGNDEFWNSDLYTTLVIDFRDLSVTPYRVSLDGAVKKKGVHLENHGIFFPITSQNKPFLPYVPTGWSVEFTCVEGSEETITVPGAAVRGKTVKKRYPGYKWARHCQTVDIQLIENDGSADFELRPDDVTVTVTSTHTQTLHATLTTHIK